jgi:uncharacterized membrane protein (UPF0127 family)
MVTCTLAAALSVVLACGDSSSGPSGGAPPVVPPTPADAAHPLGTNLTTLTFVSPTGQQAQLHVRVEATEPLREQGLMNITSLPDDEGDLFVWQDVSPNQDVYSPFWMKDTKIPLSIAFVTADGHIAEEQDMAADTTDYHIPRLPYRFAIEANLGWYQRNGMPAGSQVSLPASLPPLPPGPPPPPPPPPIRPPATPAAPATPVP